ncbi:unnamed protein product [Rhodiola kirilowii]
MGNRGGLGVRGGAVPRGPYRAPSPPPPQRRAREEYYEYNDPHEPTLAELSIPRLRNHSWCIYEDPDLEDIAISSGIVHNLPKFSGSQGESATTHLQRFHGICQNLKPSRVAVEDFKLKAFYFSLIDGANDWFLSLPSGSIQTWSQMQGKFMEKYYPAGRAMQVRRQLQEMKQGPNESMYDYVEKFNRLERSCINLGMSEKILVEYLLQGLRPLDKRLLDASAGGSIMKLTLIGIRKLIEDMAENARYQEETSRADEMSRTKSVAKAEVPSDRLTEDVKQMKEMMIHLMRREPSKVKPCEFCGAMDHRTNSCPSILEEDHGDVNAVGNYQGYQNRTGPSRPYGQGPVGEAWRHGIPKDFAQQSHHQQAPPQVTHDVYKPPHRQFQQGGPSQSQPGPSYNQGNPNPVGQNRHLEDMMKDVMKDVMKEVAASHAKLNATILQKEAKADGRMTELEKQMSNLIATVTEMKKETGRLPSQTIQNSRGNVSAVTLRSGKRLIDDLNGHEEGNESREMEENQVEPDFMPSPTDASQALGTSEPDASEILLPGQPAVSEESVPTSEESASASEDKGPSPVPASGKMGPSPVHEPEGQNASLSVPLPFPVPGRKSKKYVMDKDVWELFSRVEINIPLLEAIKQIPSYAKFLK